MEFEICAVEINFEENMDEHVSYGRFIKTEMPETMEEPLPFEENELSTVMEKLELIPVVYTTRLDDMKVLKQCSVESCPKQVTARIVKESKPSLRHLPSKKPHRNNKNFEKIKVKLTKIYASYKNVDIKEEIDIPDASTIQIDLNSVKSEVLDAPVFEKPKPKDTCPNSELLKLCKPCSVVLPLINPPYIIHSGQLLQTNKLKPVVRPPIELSSDEDDSSINSLPDLEVALNTIKNVADKLQFEFLESTRKNNHTAKWKAKSTVTANMDDTSATCLHKSQRLLRNSAVEMVDTFSKEYNLYYVDHESNLLDYIKGTSGNFQPYTIFSSDARYIVKNCCWIKKEEYIKKLYPKVLVYSNSRFMRKPHPCKPGACQCCCRKKENIMKPDLLITGENTLGNRKKIKQEDKEIQDLEDEIDKSIINIKRTAKFYSTYWLRKIKENSTTKEPKTLIQKALTYNKPKPKIVPENRRLYTIKRGDPQTSVIIFGNFAKDITEIYEINTHGQIESYIKTTCFNNTSQPGVKRLLNKPDGITETICCWFKREEVVKKVQHNKTLHATAVKFMKTNHTCQINECTCCCKPQRKEKIKLIDVTIPKRLAWTANIDKIPRNSQELPLPPLAYSASSVPVKVKQNKPQGSVKPKPSISQNDDCQITSIITSPMLRPTPQTPAKPAACTLPVAGTSPEMLSDIGDNDELSQEVNSLITSILDRFKDVRLTINSEGKVSASLNTPISSLSTVELKVLANILSFAQTQVNSLGFNVKSGMSLSNIINLKVDDVNNTALDPKSVYKAFGQNLNLNNLQNHQGVPEPNNKNSAQLTTSSLPKVPELPNVPQTYNFFTNSTSARNQHFNEAFSSFINARTDSYSDVNNETVVPVIENVFSIKEEPEETDSTAWYINPVGQDKSENSNNNRKRTESTDTSMLNVKKIRILPSANLSAESQTTLAAQPVPGTVTIGGFMTGVPMLSKNNFRVIGQTQTTGNLMPVIPPPLTQTQPILIINPLNTPNLMDTGGTVSVPYTKDSNIQNVATVTNPESNMPVLTNAKNIFHLGDNENNHLNGQNIIISHVTSGAEFVNMDTDVTDNLIAENEDVEPNDGHSADDDQEAEDFENDDVVENIVDIDEVECVDNETEEEDCILGF